MLLYFLLLLVFYPRNYNKDVFNIIKKMGADFFFKPFNSGLLQLMLR